MDKLNLFHRLIKYRPRDNITPMENFVTELFVGVMEHCPSFKEFIIKYFLSRLDIAEDIVIGDWQINTQQSFKNPDIIPDIVFLKNWKMKILVEHKVDSQPEKDQLITYHNRIDKEDGYGLILLTKIHSLEEEYPQNKYKSKYICIYWDDILIEFEQEKNDIEKSSKNGSEWFLIDHFYEF